MKKLLLLSLFGLGARTLFGGPPMPEPRASMNISPWTGFYAGVSGGYSRIQTDPRLGLGGGFNQLPPELVGNLEERGSGNFDFDGGQLGGLIGFNYQLGHLVVGLEGTGAYLWARDSRSTGALLIGQGAPPLEIRSSFKTNYLFTVGPRVGFAFGRVMPYVTGGLAVRTRAGGRARRTLAGWSAVGWNTP